MGSSPAVRAIVPARQRDRLRPPRFHADATVWLMATTSRPASLADQRAEIVMLGTALIMSFAGLSCAAAPAPSPQATETAAPSVPASSSTMSPSIPASGTATPTESPAASPRPSPSPGAPDLTDMCLTYLASEEVAAAVGEPVAASPVAVSETAGILGCDYLLAADASPGMKLVVRTDQAPAALIKEADTRLRLRTLVGLALDAGYSATAADPDFLAVRGRTAYFELHTLSGHELGPVALADLARLILPRLLPEPAP
ncbi:hypothetical protein BH18CHL1_BH18CHL1_08380 [soil metagenome]